MPIGTSVEVPAKILTMKIGRQLTPSFDNFEFEAKFMGYWGYRRKQQ